MLSKVATIPPRTFLLVLLVFLPMSGATGKEAKKWDVNHPPGPEKNVSISVDEGTWLSVDVHPNGNEIVFDLLGDIYTLPMKGGTAKPLTSGRAWDMQPRYSPDGRSIAFTSDRNGGDNLWVMQSNGKKPRAITEERFRLLNSPAWTPNGRYLIGRKHFTSRRSLGAGELWMYHVDGGNGVQLVKRPNDQKDLGEPAVARDGKSIFYSQDTTPGNVFEYNKDSNAGIYSIQRLWLEDGRTERWLGGPGGAIRPTPSPDGNYLAFITRSRGKTILKVQDLQTRATWTVSEELDRDLQETWAIHGVYPGFSWTPDSREIIFWAQGKIHRAQRDGAQMVTIPFRVDTRRTVTPALRFPVEVHPETVSVRNPRWVQLSPNGDHVLFQALGKIYVQNLSSNEVHRLTKNERGFEFYPAWSRDGKQIVYTTWSDSDLGSVRVHTVDSGKETILTLEPGHYVEPTFSPDGKMVVYRKAQGGGIVDPRWSNNPGIYRVPTDGGTPQFLLREGRTPHFADHPERLFFTHRGADGPTLEELHITTRQRMVRAQSKFATRMRVSPDGNVLAFSENYRAYSIPFPKTGKPLQIGPKMKGLPLRSVSSRSGRDLQFSGDGSAILWSEGPTLWSSTQSGRAGKPQKIATIQLKTLADMPQGNWAIQGARIISMKDDEVIENGTVLVKANRIAAVGASKDLQIPDGMWTLDGSGKTLIPGLVDVHAHAPQAWNGMTPEQNWKNLAMLAFGVTTTHDPSNNTETVFAAAELARMGAILSPRIFSTGTILYGATASITAKIESLDDAMDHVERLKQVGGISVKSYNQPRRDQRQQVIEAGRKKEMMVVPEGGALFHHNMTQVVDGHTGIEHALPIGPIYDDVLQLWSATGVGYTPTLGVAYGGLNGSIYWYQESPVWQHPLLNAFVPQSSIDPPARRPQTAPMNEWNHIVAAEGARKLVRAGGRVQIGAHGERDGLAAHWEMWMLAQGGMTPLEVLRAATLDGAYYLGMEDDIGSIEVGKLADLVLIDGNPLDSIRETEKVEWVVLNGRLYRAATLHEEGLHPKKRPKLYFKRDSNPE